MPIKNGPEPVVKWLTAPTEAEIDECTNVLAEAFVDDPLTPIFTANNRSLSFLQLRAEVVSTAKGGLLQVLVLPCEGGSKGNGKITGVAAWYPPETSSNGTAHQRAAGWDAFMDAAGEELRNWWREYFIPSLKSLHSTCLPPQFVPPRTWHLNLIGILPQYQGQGWRRMPFAAGEQEASRTNSAMTLETSTDADIRFYTKLGFGVAGCMPVVSPWGKDQFVLMVKPGDEEQRKGLEDWKEKTFKLKFHL